MIHHPWRTLAIAVFCAALTACAVAPNNGALVIEKQGSFFVGGRSVRSDTLSTLPASCKIRIVSTWRSGSMRGSRAMLKPRDASAQFTIHNSQYVAP